MILCQKKSFFCKSYHHCSNVQGIIIIIPVRTMSVCTGEVECEPPNNRLNKFFGTLTIRDEEQPEETATQYSLDNDKILLRVSYSIIIIKHIS